MSRSSRDLFIFPSLIFDKNIKISKEPFLLEHKERANVATLVAKTVAQHPPQHQHNVNNKY